MGRLLNALGVAVRTHEGIEDGQDVTAVTHHALKNITKLRVAFCLAVPFGKDHRGHFDVSPQLVRGMTAQEQAVEKGGLALREVEIVHDFGGNELWHGGHKENAVYPKAAPRQVGLRFSCHFVGNSPFREVRRAGTTGTGIERGGCQAVLIALGC